MARSKFPVEVQTPEGEAWSGEVEMVSTKTASGSIGVLANHAPLMAFLEPCELKLYEDGSEDPKSASPVRFAQGEGYLQVVENSALVLVEEAIPPDELDRSDLESRLEEAKARLEEAKPSGREDEGWAPRQLASPERMRETERVRRAELNVKRYETFLEIASGDSG